MTGRTFDVAAWPVQPGAALATTRPARIVEALAKSGWQFSEFRSHGRTSTSATIHDVPHRGTGRPWVTVRGRSAALTPLVRGQLNNILWADMYDDWSISPLVQRPTRVLAAATYRRIGACAGVVTVNSEYMRLRVGGGAAVVPNGVDPAVASLERGTDERSQVVVLGALDRRRSGPEVYGPVIDARPVKRLLVAGSGTQELASQARDSGWAVSHFRSLTPAEVARQAGPRSVAWLPLRVCDYTLSQDPMKTYLYLALGMRVVIPRMLVPDALRAHGDVLMYEHADEVPDLLEYASSFATERGRSERSAFAGRHSWAERAATISRLMERR